MFASGEFHTVLAWWALILLLTPFVFWSMRLPYVALRTIVLTSFLTQFFTLPFFYVYKDLFIYQDIKPFEFTYTEALPILLKIALFLATFIIFFRLFYRILFPGRRHLKTINSSIFPYERKFKPRKNCWQYVVLIVVLIAILLPISFWSYSQGIGLTGVDPKVRLPFHLIGILFYLVKFITPLVLVYLYYNTSRHWALTLLLLTYAILLGWLTVSKGVIIMIVFPVLIMAWLDRSRLIFLFGGLFAAIGIVLVTQIRTYVYIVSDGVSFSDTSVNIFSLSVKSFYVIWGKLDLILFEFVKATIGRVESFFNLVMSQYYDPNLVDSAPDFLLRMIWKGFSPIDTGLHSIQWQGELLPQGFYNGGSLLSNIIIVGNSNLIWVVVGAIIASMMLVILEKSIHVISFKYKINSVYSSFAIFYFSIVFFLESGGGNIFLYPAILIFFISFLPRFYISSPAKGHNE